jgi:flagellar biosynthesis protein FliP
VTFWRTLGCAACLLVLPSIAFAQSLNIDLGAAGEAGATGRLVQITALVTVLSLAPSLLVMVTAFTRIVIVLSLLRSALSTQGTPPNMVMIATLDASGRSAHSLAPRSPSRGPSG